MVIRFDRLGVPICGLALGIGSLMLALLAYNNRLAALDKLHRWPTFQATATQLQYFGSEKTQRVTVSFLASDDRKKEGFLFDGENHHVGENILIHYDPQGIYPTEIFSTAELVEQTSLSTFWGAMGVGFVLTVFSSYRIYKIRKSVVLARMEEHLNLPMRLIYPTFEERRALRQVPGHEGKPQKNKTEFIVSPPTEILPLLSAESNILIGGPKPYIQRLLVGALGASLLLLGFHWGSKLWNDDPAGRQNFMMIGYVLAALVFAAHGLAVRYRPDCSYVGERGLARCAQRGIGIVEPDLSMMQFGQAVELRVVVTDVYIHHVHYKGTVFHFYWTNSSNQVVWQIKGSFKKRRKTKEGQPWRFAQAAETAWCAYYFRIADQQLSNDGSIFFRLDDRRSLRVGPGFVDFNFDGNPQRVNSEDIVSARLVDGVFTIKTNQAELLSSKGRYSFPYRELANAKSFLQVFAKLTDRKFES